jgi:hypothetical protein
MSEFDVTDVTRIARRAVDDQALPLRVVGAVLGGRGSDYVEVLVTIEGCASEPCQLAVGVFRNTSEEHLTKEITLQLRRHLDSHRSPPH